MREQHVLCSQGPPATLLLCCTGWTQTRRAKQGLAGWPGCGGDNELGGVWGTEGSSLPRTRVLLPYHLPPAPPVAQLSCA